LVRGVIQIADVPANLGATVSLCFLAVDSADEPPPYDGNPPVDAVADGAKVFDQVNLASEIPPNALMEIPFSVVQEPGVYYLQIRVIMYRRADDRTLAQAEQFFFARRPLEVPESGVHGVELPVSWPSLPIDELHHYGTIKPELEVASPQVVYEPCGFSVVESAAFASR